MSYTELIVKLSSLVWDGPMLVVFGFFGLFLTVALYGIQFRFFGRAWKLLLAPEETQADVDAYMTPLQAFLNALGNGVGNGSIAGVATAIAAGGPGAAFWMIVAATLGMVIRFTEVYLGVCFIGGQTVNGALGGPMVYLSRVPGGRFLPYLFALFCMMYGLSSGNAMQGNSIALGLQDAAGISPWYVAVALTAFVLYVMLGGAKRIIAASDRIVPIKVGVFLISAIIALIYQIDQLIPALKLIVHHAFSPVAVGGAAIGIAVRDAMRYGFSRSINANEGGLGTASLLYGTTGCQRPVEDSLASMLSIFIGTHIICFLMALLIVMSGAWQHGLTSTPLAAAAIAPAFGSYAGWIISFCAASFGVGLLVTYAFIGRECWFFLTGRRFEYGFIALYAGVTFLGTISSVEAVWSSIELVTAGMLLLNFYGMWFLLPDVRKAVRAYINR